MVNFMLAVVHNKLGFPIVVSDILIKPHGTEKIDLPNGFKYNTNQILVSYINEEKQTVVEDEKEVIETIAVEPVVKEKPKVAKKRKKRSSK